MIQGIFLLLTSNRFQHLKKTFLMNYFQPYMEVLKQTRRDLIYGIIYIKYNNM